MDNLLLTMLKSDCNVYLTKEQSKVVYDYIQKLLSDNETLEAQVKKLKERNRKLDVDLLRALFYAPSSPVSAQKAQEIEVWYGKFKQVVLAAKGGE